MLRDGAMAAGCLFDRAQICETFLRGVEGLIRTHAARRLRSTPKTLRDGSVDAQSALFPRDLGT
jgi:hypothetical protein